MSSHPWQLCPHNIEHCNTGQGYTHAVPNKVVRGEEIRGKVNKEDMEDMGFTASTFRQTHHQKLQTTVHGKPDRVVRVARKEPDGRQYPIMSICSKTTTRGRKGYTIPTNIYPLHRFTSTARLSYGVTQRATSTPFEILVSVRQPHPCRAMAEAGSPPHAIRVSMLSCATEAIFMTRVFRDPWSRTQNTICGYKTQALWRLPPSTRPMGYLECYYDWLLSAILLYSLAFLCIFSHPSLTSNLAFDRKTCTSPSRAQSRPSETLFSGRRASNQLSSADNITTKAYFSGSG